MTASPYRVATRILKAVIDVGSSRESEVELYLANVSEAHGGPETVGEALNRQRAFLPLKDGDSGDNYLLRRASIRSVRVKRKDSHHVEPGGDRESESETDRDRNALGFVDDVRLELTGGGFLEGTLVTVMPPSKSRLSDFFNSNETSFVPLFVDEHVVYVNKEWVATIRW